MPLIQTENHGSLAIIPYQAKSPIKEILEFKTAINETFHGSEERHRLKRKPRHTYTYSHSLDNSNYQHVWNTLYRGIREQFAVPIWTEGQYVGRLEADTEYIRFETYLDFRENSLAIAIDCHKNWQIIELGEDIGSNNLEFLNSVTSMNDCTIYPVRLGKISSQGQIRTTGSSHELDLTYEIEQSDLWYDDSWNPDTYLTQNVYTTKTLRQGMSNRIIDSRLDVFDKEVGSWEHRGPWFNNRYETTFRQHFQNNTQVKNFKKFLCYNGGRFGQFWYPTQDVNIRLKSTGLIEDEVYIWKDSFNDWQNRINIGFQRKNGLWYFRLLTVLVTDIDETTARITLTESLDLQAEEIKRVSWIGLNRLNSDRIEFNWTTNGFCEMETSFVEINPQSFYYLDLS